MGRRALHVLLATIAAGLLAPLAVSAERRVHQQRSAPQGPVEVRPVRVREVRVPDSRAPDVSFRPVTPQFISRPNEPISGPNVDNARVFSAGPSSRGTRGHRRSHEFKDHKRGGFGPVVGYPVAFVYPSIDSSAFYAPITGPPGTVSAPNAYSNVESVTGSTSSPLPAPCEPAACGGVSFDITPTAAQVFVDGVFVGTVEDFGPTTAPLLLEPGDYYVEIRRAGFRSATFDVSIVAGEVIPYQGTLVRLRLRQPQN